MTLDAYAAVGDLRGELRIDGTDDDARLERVLNAAARSIEHHCGGGRPRRFKADAAPSTRRFTPGSSTLVRVDDCASITLVEEDATITGSWATVPATEYLAHPLDLDGWPVLRLEAIGRWWAGLIRVTATFGWPSTPAPVTEANLILAGRLWHRNTTPQGVIAGDFGIVRLGRTDPDVAELLRPYTRLPGVV